MPFGGDARRRCWRLPLAPLAPRRATAIAATRAMPQHGPVAFGFPWLPLSLALNENRYKSSCYGWPCR